MRSIIVSPAILLCQGFHLWGFDLDVSLLKWLIAATIGETGGLAALVYTALFK